MADKLTPIEFKKIAEIGATVEQARKRIAEQATTMQVALFAFSQIGRTLRTSVTDNGDGTYTHAIVPKAVDESVNS